MANIDPVELERALAGAAPDTTLIVAVSKTFSTQETISNATAVRRLGFENLVAVTANPNAARQFGASDILELPESVGGRYSVWSAAGFAGLLAIGSAAFGEFLAGGRDMDEHFRGEPLDSNVPALLALLGVWNVNFLGMHAHAVLPYAHRLRLLPAYLQQLEMESNGKGVDREGRPVAYATCPVLFGAEGTPAQHAFTQLLHQGTPPVAADFIDASVSGALSANLRAQADALAYGTDAGTGDAALPPHQRHPGNRPSSILTLPGLHAARPGAADRAVRAQGVHPGRAVEHQQLRPVGRGAGQADGATHSRREVAMDQETFNLSIRKFLKMVGVNSQREIEQAVQKALEATAHQRRGDPGREGDPGDSLARGEGAVRRRDQVKIETHHQR